MKLRPTSFFLTVLSLALEAMLAVQPAPSQGRWLALPSVPKDIPANDLVVSRSNTYYMASSSLLKSTDLGNTWTSICDTAFSKIYVESDSVIIGLYSNYESMGSLPEGAIAYTVLTTNGGNTWNRIMPSNEPTRKLLFDNKGGIYWQGDKNTYVSFNKGEKWSLFTQSILYTNIIRDPSNAIFLNADFTILRSTNGGIGWDTSLKNTGQIMGLRAIGNSILVRDYQHTFRSTDQGTTWKTFSDSELQQLYGLPKLLSSEKGGEQFWIGSFSFGRSIGSYFFNPTSVFAFDSLGNWLSAPNKRSLLFSTDQGNSWILKGSGVAGFTRAIFTSTNELLAQGAFFDPTIFRYNNTSGSWDVAAVPGYVATLERYSIFLSRSFISFDAGRTWRYTVEDWIIDSVQYAPNPNAPPSYWFDQVNGKLLGIVWDPALSVCLQADTRHFQRKVRGQSSKWPVPFGTTRDGVVAIAADSLLLSFDYGETWKKRPLPDSLNNITYVQTVWDSNLLISNYPKTYLSNDKGETWKLLDTSFGAWKQLVYDPFTHGLLTCTDSNVYLSFDKGKTWKQATDGLPSKASSFQLLADLKGKYYLLSNGAAYQWIWGSLVESQSTKSSRVAYPNPAQEVIHIPVSNVSSEPTLISITDPLGRHIYTGSPSELNTQYISIDLRRYPIGLYYYRVVSNSEASTGSFMVQR